MFGRYKGRIISTIFFISAVSIWNSIYYGFYNYHYNIVLDTSYTAVLAIIVWWIASYYDHSKWVLTNLALSEESYKKLLDETNYVFNNLNQVVYQTDKHGYLTMLNPAWTTLTGFSLHESIGISLDFFVYPEDQPLSKELYKRTLHHDPFTMQEFRIRKSSGGFVWIEMNAKNNYDTNGNLLSTVGTLTDITERKLSERKLLQINENLTIRSEKLSVIAQMSAAIAHEVRNPLTSISGFLQLLKERKQLDHEYINIVFSEIERIELVLGELLLLSKPQAVSFHKLNINKTIDHVVTLLSSKANMNSIEMQFQPSKEPIWVYGDENQLKQVFINILKNGIEAISDKGSILINFGLSSNFISIYITDTGSGIPEDILNKIGQPFYTTKDKGTGLGLTTCFKIIETHKGKIHISSQLGKGTTFEVILPLFEPTNTTAIELPKNPVMIG